VNRCRVLTLMLMFSAAALVVACVTPIAQTSVDRAAKAKSVPNAPYSKVMIVGIAQQGTRGREFEEQLVKELGNKRTYAFGYRRAASRADVKQEVVEELLQAQGADAVIFVTAKAEEEDELKGFDLGAVDYITKPFQVEEVLARIQTHLNLYKLQHLPT